MNPQEHSGRHAKVIADPSISRPSRSMAVNMLTESMTQLADDGRKKSQRLPQFVVAGVRVRKCELCCLCNVSL